MIILYVDDMIIASNQILEVRRVIQLIETKWELDKKGEPKFMLGIEINRNKRDKTIKLSQSASISELIRKYKLDDERHRPTSTPVYPHNKLSNKLSPQNDAEKIYMHGPYEQLTSETTSSKTKVKTISRSEKYRSLVGSLMYIMLGTRPDIAFAVSNLSKYVSNPGIIHWKAALHCLLYLKGTIDKCITYKAIYTNPLTLVSFTDSDWAGCHDTRRSHSGGVIFLGGGPTISWISQQQINCALSSAEAELNALVLNTKEVLWLRRILDNLSLPQCEPTTLYGDNTSSMLIAKEQRINKNTKHIELYFHFIKEEIQQFHSIQLRYIH